MATADSQVGGDEEREPPKGSLPRRTVRSVAVGESTPGRGVEGEQSATEVTRGIARAQVTKVNEPRELAISQNEVAAVQVPVQPPRLSGEGSCSKPVSEVTR